MLGCGEEKGSDEKRWRSMQGRNETLRTMWNTDKSQSQSQMNRRMVAEMQRRDGNMRTMWNTDKSQSQMNKNKIY